MSAEQGAGKNALRLARKALEHLVPEHCWATGPSTGDKFADLVACPGCCAIRAIDEELAAPQPAAGDGEACSGRLRNLNDISLYIEDRIKVEASHDGNVVEISMGRAKEILNALSSSMYQQSAANPSAAVDEPRLWEEIKSLTDFAYEQGFHELGHDPVAQIREVVVNLRRNLDDALRTVSDLSATNAELRRDVRGYKNAHAVLMADNDRLRRMRSDISEMISGHDCCIVFDDIHRALNFEPLPPPPEEVKS